MWCWTKLFIRRWTGLQSFHMQPALYIWWAGLYNVAFTLLLICFNKELGFHKLYFNQFNDIIKYDHDWIYDGFNSLQTTFIKRKCPPNYFHRIFLSTDLYIIAKKMKKIMRSYHKYLLWRLRGNWNSIELLSYYKETPKVHLDGTKELSSANHCLWVNFIGFLEFILSSTEKNNQNC